MLVCFKDDSSTYPQGAQHSFVSNSQQQQRRDSPPKRVVRGSQQKQQKQMSPDEWLEKIKAELQEPRDEDDENVERNNGGGDPTRRAKSGAVRGQQGFLIVFFLQIINFCNYMEIFAFNSQQRLKP